jgi:hypothetical protein
MDMKVSPKAKPEPSFDSEWLTPSEIESLRQQKRDWVRLLAERAEAEQKTAAGTA